MGDAILGVASSSGVGRRVGRQRRYIAPPVEAQSTKYYLAAPFIILLGKYYYTIITENIFTSSMMATHSSAGVFNRQISCLLSWLNKQKDLI